MHLQTQTERSQLSQLCFFPHFLSLQCDCGAASSAVSRRGDGKQLEVEGAGGPTVRDVSKIKDSSEMKMLVSELTAARSLLSSFSLFTQITQSALH